MTGKSHAILYKGLECPQMLVSVEGPVTNPEIPEDDCSLLESISFSFTSILCTWPILITRPSDFLFFLQKSYLFLTKLNLNPS